jgi:hypothetical protein
MAPANAPPTEMPDFRVTPLMMPPNFPAQQPNFNNPESRGPMAMAIMGVMLGFMTTALVLRMYARQIVLRNVGLDDWVGLMAAVS